MTNTTAADILSAVKQQLGIALFESTDSNGSYLHGRLEGGLWVVATDAQGYAYSLRDRIAHETAPYCECCGDEREPSGLGWSVGIYRNCTDCGDDHPADCSFNGSVASVVDNDATTEQLASVIVAALQQT